MDEPKLTSARVVEIAKGCFYRAEEVMVDGQRVQPPETVEFDGITTKFGFHPGRLESHRQDVQEMLDELPEQFSAGGGHSFLQMCFDKNDRQWADFHRVMETLVAVGGALGLVRYCAPRSMWFMLEGRMPYLLVSTTTCPFPKAEMKS